MNHYIISEEDLDAVREALRSTLSIVATFYDEEGYTDTPKHVLERLHKLQGTVSESWQPIETAPKDGTEVIGIHYIDFGDGISPMVDGPFTVRFSGKNWTSSWDGCEVVDFMDWGGTDYMSILEPTHWMSLPKPPES